jgi:hypothetical protein
MGVDILMGIFGSHVQGVLNVLLRKRSALIAVPHCPSCGSPRLQRWAPAVSAVASALGVAVAYVALAIGFWWVVLFVGVIVTGNLTFGSFGTCMVGVALILVCAYIGGAASIHYRRFPPRRCRQCGTRWAAVGHGAR